MTMASLDISNGNQINLTGVLDFNSVPEVHQRGKQLLQEGRDLIVNLAGVSYSDSAGLALLADWIRLANKYNRVVAYANMPEQMMSIAQVTGIDKFLPLT